MSPRNPGGDTPTTPTGSREELRLSMEEKEAELEEETNGGLLLPTPLVPIPEPEPMEEGEELLVLLLWGMEERVEPTVGAEGGVARSLRTEMATAPRCSSMPNQFWWSEENREKFG